MVWYGGMEIHLYCSWVSDGLGFIDGFDSFIIDGLVWWYGGMRFIDGLVCLIWDCMVYLISYCFWDFFDGLGWWDGGMVE